MFQPRWRHVSQLRPDGQGGVTGRNDCAEASIARYLLEYYPHGGVAGEWTLVGAVLDPASPATVWDLVDRLSLLARGVPDTPGNAPTTADQIDTALRAFGVRVARDYGPTAYEAAYNAPFGLCNVDACALRPARYPAGWLGNECDQPNHLILWLPPIGGQANWFNDPLAQDGQDCQYDLASVRSALYGVWPLPWVAQVMPPAGPSIVRHAAIKGEPNHVCPAIGHVVAGQAVQRVDSSGWALIRTAAGVVGWVTADNLRDG